MLGILSHRLLNIVEQLLFADARYSQLLRHSRERIVAVDARQQMRCRSRQMRSGSDAVVLGDEIDCLRVVVKVRQCAVDGDSTAAEAVAFLGHFLLLTFPFAKSAKTSAILITLLALGHGIVLLSTGRRRRLA